MKTLKLPSILPSLESLCEVSVDQLSKSTLAVLAENARRDLIEARKALKEDAKAVYLARDEASSFWRSLFASSQRTSKYQLLLKEGLPPFDELQSLIGRLEILDRLAQARQADHPKPRLIADLMLFTYKALNTLRPLNKVLETSATALNIVAKLSPPPAKLPCPSSKLAHIIVALGRVDFWDFRIEAFRNLRDELPSAFSTPTRYDFQDIL